MNMLKTMGLKELVLISAIGALTACGGGGKSDPEPDTKPNPFSFTIPSGTFAKGAEIETNSVTINGINEAVAVTVTNGEASVNGGAYAASRTISNGQSLQIKANAADAFDGTVTVTVRVGTETASFTITTEARDTMPDAFTFTAISDAELSTEVTSESIAISGINDCADIELEAGSSFTLSGDSLTCSANQIATGQSISITTTSAATVSTPTSVPIIIGDVASSFTVTTFADTTAPTASIAFPPPTSMTANTTLTVRGTAEDDYSDIASIAIYINGSDSGVVVTSDDSFATWSGQVTLTPGDNEIAIVAEDAEENFTVLAEATSVHVKQQGLHNYFPETGTEVSFGNPSSTVIVNRNESTKIYVADRNSNLIIEVDLQTGLRTPRLISGLPETANTRLSTLVYDDINGILYGGSNSPSEDAAIFSLNVADWSIVNSIIVSYDELRLIGQMTIERSTSAERVLMSSVLGSAIYQADLELESVDHFADWEDDPENSLDGPAGLAYIDSLNSIFAFTSLFNEDSNFYTLSPTTGTRTVFSTPEDYIDVSDSWIAQYGVMTSLTTGSSTHIFATSEADTNSLLKINTSNGDRELFSDNPGLMDFEKVRGIDSDETLRYLVVCDTSIDALFAVDLATGERVVISKSSSQTVP